MSFEIPGTGFGLIFLFAALVVIGIILVLKNIMKSRAATDLKGKYEATPFKSPIEGRAKYPDVDPFRWSGTFLNVGLVLALLLATSAFAWTVYEEKIFIPDNALELDEEISIEPPRTAEPPPPPPPPPPPVIEEVPEELMEEEEEVVFEDQSLSQDDVVEAPPPKEAAPPPPPPPPPPPKKEAEIFRRVEEMPMFPGCEDKPKDDRKQCAEEKLLKFIYKNIKYPAIARENNIQGTVVASFVIEKDGSITDAKILRDIGGQCGDEALRVVNMMPKWTPGKQRGRAVRVQFNLPVRFKLE